MRTTTSHTRLTAVIVATVALASGCKDKSPTEPGAPFSFLSAEATVLDAMQSGAMAACGAPAVLWKGIRHTPAGQARLTVIDDASPMIVDGIGPSGRDGVCSITASDHAWSNGAYFRAKFEGIDGESNDAHHVVRVEWQLPAGQRYQAGFSMAPSNGLSALSVTAPHMNCRLAAIEFLMDGAVVGGGQVACATAGKLKGSYPIAVLAEVDVWEHWTVSADGFGWGLNSGDSQRVSANLPGRPALVVDEIRFFDVHCCNARLVRTMITVADPGPIPGRLVISEFAPVVP